MTMNRERVGLCHCWELKQGSLKGISRQKTENPTLLW